MVGFGNSSNFDFGSFPRSMADEARAVGHPDPENATQGEINVLSLAAYRFGGAVPREEAQRILHIAEFDADFNS